MLRRGNKARFEHFFPEGYMLAGLSYQALYRKDKKFTEKVENVAGKLLDDNGIPNYTINICDQLPAGICFINLYRLTGKEKYKKAYEHYYQAALSMCQENYYIPYIKGLQTQYVDALGMFTPFLMEYYNQNGDSLAYTIAYANMSIYYKYCVDKETGIPAHGYDAKSKLKVGSINWGRGIGWYLIAAAYLPEFHDSLLEQSLKSMEYTQFPLSSSHFDATTALSFEIYKHSRDKNRKKSLDFIKKYIRTDGNVDCISGETHDVNNYNKLFGLGEIGNGWLLMLTADWFY